MTEITISNGVTTVTMPRTRRVVDAGANVDVVSTMASGLEVCDRKGFRPGFTYTWDYVPAATITALITMLRTGKYFTVNYFDVDGTDRSGVFSIDYPSLEVFAFRDGVAVWHNCSITIRSQGVVR